MQAVLRADRARRAVGRQRAHHRRARHGQGGRRARRSTRRSDRAGAAASSRSTPAASREGVFESELFGHVKGAFTDAKADRIGCFELADGGTLFLDEIGNMPLGQQAKLLRVLQTGEFAPGRLVAGAPRRRARARRDQRRPATPRWRPGRFREDLLYRLNTVEVQLPPLRERREDIPPLAAHFLAAQAARYAQAGAALRAGGAGGAARVPVARQRARAGARASSAPC